MGTTPLCLSLGNLCCLLRAILLQEQKSWLDIEGKWQTSAGLSGQYGSLKDLFPGHSDNKMMQPSASKEHNTLAFLGYPRVLYNNGHAEQGGTTGATYCCRQSSSVNKEHQAFWLQREEKLLVLHRNTVRKWVLMKNKTKSKETQALLLDLLQIWWIGQQNSPGFPGCAHTASWFSLWTHYFISGCSECCDPWMWGAKTK